VLLNIVYHTLRDETREEADWAAFDFGSYHDRPGCAAAGMAASASATRIGITEHAVAAEGCVCAGTVRGMPNN